MDTQFFFFFFSSPDVVEIAVYRNELFCLHGDGRMSHLSLLSVERCVDRLLRREAWSLAATVCVMFQHAIAPSRVRLVLLQVFHPKPCPLSPLRAF